MSRRNSLLLGCCLLALFVVQSTVPSTLDAQTAWPRFRGADGLGNCAAATVPVRWSAEDVVWRAELPGQGHSSVCLWDQRIFVTAARQNDSGGIERVVLGLNRGDGQVIWKHVASVGEGESVHKMNSFATPTCATDGQRVVAFFGRGGIHCFDMDGQQLWTRTLGDFPGPWGSGASPIIVGDTVIQNSDAEGDAFLIALDKHSGEVVWKTSRGTLPRGGWSTPFLIDTGSRQELVLNGEFGVNGYDPSSGRELWFCKSFNGRGTPTPAFGHGLLYVISGKSGDAYAVRPGGEGDVTQSRMVWHTRRAGGRDLSSPILVGDHVFVVNMAGIGTCYDAKTGQELWKERLSGAFSASPITAGGLIYVQNEGGTTLVIKPGSKLEIVAENELGAPADEIFRSTLAVADGQLFFRSQNAVYCVGKLR